MKKKTNFSEDDLIKNILRSVSLRTVLYFRSELRVPWGIMLAAREAAFFHVVTRGQCWLEVEGQQGFWRLQAGDVMILPQGNAHSLRNAPHTLPTRLEDVLTKNPLKEGRLLCFGGQGPLTTLVCGGFDFSDWKINPLRLLLPIVLHIKGRKGQVVSSLKSLLTYVQEECDANQPGEEIVLTRVSEVFFVKALQSYLVSSKNEESELAALRDSQIGRLLSAIHDHPERAWTLKSLAKIAGMSRSALSQQFKTVVGESPQRYVTRCRLNRAAQFLEATDTKIVNIARRVGYGSEFSFSRAFKRALGTTPKGYRRETLNKKCQLPD